MEDTLQRLLAVELKAQKLVDKAMEERDLTIERAREEIRAAEERLNARIPEIRQSFQEKAELRASQTVAELQRRFQERFDQLQQMADNLHEDALGAALALVVDVNRI